MKIAIVILAVAVIVLSIMVYNSEQTAVQQQLAASNQVAAAQAELTGMQAQLVGARAELTDVRTQVESRVSELQQHIAMLDADRARDAQQLEVLTNQLNSARSALEQSQSKLLAAEKEGERLAGEIQAVSNQLVSVQQKLGDLQKTHDTTLGHLTAMREDYVRLTAERAQLEAKLHDLKTLKAQINVVKQELHAQKVAERQRVDRAEMALGNGGFLMRNGEWVIARTPGSYPLNGEIHRGQ